MLLEQPHHAGYSIPITWSAIRLVIQPQCLLLPSLQPLLLQLVLLCETLAIQSLGSNAKQLLSVSLFFLIYSLFRPQDGLTRTHLQSKRAISRVESCSLCDAYCFNWFSYSPRRFRILIFDDSVSCSSASCFTT